MMDKATQCQRDETCTGEPVGLIPTPHTDIHVCRRHADEALEHLFYVEFYTGANNLHRLDFGIRAKHLSIRGNDHLRVDSCGRWRVGYGPVRL